MNRLLFAAARGDWCDYKEHADDLHRALFLLILAESLADSGL